MQFRLFLVIFVGIFVFVVVALCDLLHNVDTFQFLLFVFALLVLVIDVETKWGQR